MSFNRFGHLFQVTTFGESHGPAIGCVVDGCPPQVPFSLEKIQAALDRRRPGTSRHTSQRRELDQVSVLSGIYTASGRSDLETTGTPIAMLIQNNDARSRDYKDIGRLFRPGHADFTYLAKYGIRDPAGGGRASARETAMRVAAGALARQVLDHMFGCKLEIRGALVQLADCPVDRDRWNWAEVGNNPLFCPDAETVPVWEKYLDRVRREGSSCGAVVEIEASGVPAGWGAPVYGKMDGEIAAAMMSINAVKGVEIGAGFNAASMRGEDAADEMLPGGEFRGNEAGGILGGITSGQDIVCRFSVKPAASIVREQDTIDVSGESCRISTRGRHDPCVGIRAVPVGEAMMACVLLDQCLRHRGQTGRVGPSDWQQNVS